MFLYLTQVFEKWTPPPRLKKGKTLVGIITKTCLVSKSIICLGMDVFVQYTNDSSSPAILNFDVEDDMGVVLSSYLYENKGSYNICVTAINNVSSYVEYFIHPVLYAIQGLNITLIQEKEGGPDGMYDFIEQGENITIITTVRVKILITEID